MDLTKVPESTVLPSSCAAEYAKQNDRSIDFIQHLSGVNEKLLFSDISHSQPHPNLNTLHSGISSMELSDSSQLAAGTNCTTDIHKMLDGPQLTPSTLKAETDQKGTKKSTGKAKKRKEKSLVVLEEQISFDGSTDLATSSESVQQLLQAVRSQVLPFPLPVPVYSQTVQAARASGNVLSERATIIRETVKFFLVYKYWWTSEDYDRIAELVVSQFPELRDPDVSAAEPCYSKVRLDLSMCARNFRRIAKNQKRRGSLQSLNTVPVYSDAKTGVKTSKTSGKSASREAEAAASPDPVLLPSHILPHTAHSAHPTTTTTMTAHGIREMGSALLMTSANGGSSTVLPPVAHFLAHPSGHGQMSAGTTFSSVSQPAVSAVKETVAFPSAEVSAGPQESKQPCEDVRPSNTMARHDNFLDNCNAAASTWQSEGTLPDPLPVPPYSNKRRLRAELSQAARNVRRREMMNRKRDGLSAANAFSAVGTVVKPASGGQQLSTDFCNELLTAASIIESRTAALHQKDLDNSSELHSRLLGEVGILNAGLLNENQKVTSLDHADSYEKIEAMNSANLVKLSSEESGYGLSASVKQEVGDELEQYHLLQQAQQAWLSAQVSQAFSLQALSGLSAQAFSVAHLACSPVSHQTIADKAATANSTLQASSHLQGSAAVHEEMVSPLSSCTSVSDEGNGNAMQVDRMSAMAMWRSTCLPDPLPIPPYSLNVLRARDSGNTASARPRIIRETTQFFLSLKMWWTTQDYERIADLVVQQFPDLQNMHNIKKDLGTCARNMRRRLPLSRNKFLSGEQLMQLTAPMQEGEHSQIDTRLGELANMAVREAQDKEKFDLASSVSLTAEQRDALAFALLDQGAARLASLCPQYEAFGSQATSIAQILTCKRNLTDSLERNSDLNVAQKNLTDLLERKSEFNVAKKLTSPDSFSDLHSKKLVSEVTVKHHDTASKSKRKRKEPSVKVMNYHKSMIIDQSENKSDVANAIPVSQEQKVLADTEAVYHSPQVAQHVSTLSFDMVPAHQQAQFIYPQPDNHDGKLHNCSEDEAPINLTCNSETVKQTKVQKVKSKGTKKGTNIDETFNAREQVWLPHGSPYKKGGQNVFKALPSPLPVPKYSQKLLKAREEGTINRHRSEIIRETARFFLGFKYWWSSADYSRISELVVSQFPELRDTLPLSGQPLYRRVQRDLSMCARNLRRKNSRCQRLSENDLSPAASKENENITKCKRVKKEIAVKQEVMENESSKDGAHNYLKLEGSHSNMVSTPVRSQNEGDTTHTEAMHVDRQQGDAVPSPCSVSAALTQTSVSAEDTTLPSFAAMAGTSNSASAILTSLASHQLMPVFSGFHVGTNMEDVGRNDCKEKVRCSPKTPKPHVDMVKNNAAPNAHSPRSAVFNKGSSQQGETQASRFSISDSRLLSDTSVTTSSLSQTHAWESHLAGSTNFDKVFVNPEHGSDLQTQLTKLWHEGKFFDASLEVDDCRLPVHKLVLLAASPYLQNTYSHANPTAHLEVNLPRETGISAAQDFLKYMYEGVLRITPASVTALRRIAIMLQIEQLSLYCDEYLSWLASVSAAAYPLMTKNTIQQERLPRLAASLEEQMQGMVTAENCSQFTSEMALTTSSHALTHDVSHTHVHSVTRHLDAKAAAVVRSGKKKMQPLSAAKSVYHNDKGHSHHGAGSLPRSETPVMISYKDIRGEQLDHQALRGLGLSQLSSSGAYFNHHGPVVDRKEEEATAACLTASTQSVVQLDLEGNVADASESGQACIDGEQVIATLMTSTDMGVDGDGCVEVECASENLQQFAEEAGRQVVEEVVIEAGELLQDVEVAACETVECSLLPQTYCSSPHSTPSQANSILQTMASQWAAEHYAHAPLDEATAQQFAAVLQERMYGHRTSSNAHFHKTSTVGRGENENPKELLDGCVSFVSVQSRPSKDFTDLALGSVRSTGNAAYAQDMAHLLPQTYCASSQSPTPVTSQ